jgi:hypothetical protein
MLRKAALECGSYRPEGQDNSSLSGPHVDKVRQTADTVTVLCAKGGKLLTKRWTLFEDKLQETAYDRAWRFSATEHPVRDIAELGELIRQISADPQAAVVRGAIANGANRNDMLRRARPRGDAPATLLPKPRRWLGLDLEKIPCPPKYRRPLRARRNGRARDLATAPRVS